MKKNKVTSPSNKKDKALPGYPIYPSKDDIYSREKEETEINPEDLSKRKARNAAANELNEKDFPEDVTGDDLDVPGSELDEAEENSGSEDEENNYYSLGGDDHDDLEEDKGD